MEDIISQFKGKKVLIIGDVMLDAYIIGKVDRVSPEAPVPIVNIESKEDRLGGAANVALNIKALGATPILISAIGDDKDGETFLKIIKKNQIDGIGIFKSKQRTTTTKTRILGNKHQLLRLDSESAIDLDNDDHKTLISIVKQQIKSCDVVILQDYNKGVLTEKNIPLIIEIALKAKKPIAVDPKKKNFLAYKGVTLFKPNLKEIKEGLNTDKNLKKNPQLIEAVIELNLILNNALTMVTLSEDGVMITDHSTFEFIPAHIRNISDVSGAGDTVISVASLCLACKYDKYLIAELSNLAGGLVCEENGVVPINIDKFIKEISLIL
ncbi:MAG: PfkB family carbohydrate kinase [Bacteroidota bacterium]|nr:PfkB family carbohydrate kinase [Bacteroidota bacterium]